MKIIEVKNRTSELISCLLDVWEGSVRATHLFLSDREIRNIKEYVPQALKGVGHLVIAEDEAGCPKAFMGIEDGSLEMLFVAPEERGKGLGKRLLRYGIENYAVERLAVNEQNPQAKGFYEHMGFRVYKRTELDEQGNPYPLLYMSRTEKSLETMKTIRLFYPDHVSGGLEAYYFGAHLLTHILPQNERQPLVKVDIAPPDHKEKEVEEGIYAREEVLAGIEDAAKKIEGEKPDRIITIGGNCMVSLAPFDYLHGKYKDTGIIWIDAHPDVSSAEDGYPNAHAMVLRTLLGYGPEVLSERMRHGSFEPSQVLYIGLQPLHDYQERFLNDIGVDYKVQEETFVPDHEILEFVKKFEHILVHLDVDVLDEHFFHSTYFADPELTGDGSGGGKMTIEKLTEVLGLITKNVDVAGFTIAEYLPFDEYKLHKMFSGISLFIE